MISQPFYHAHYLDQLKRYLSYLPIIYPDTHCPNTLQRTIQRLDNGHCYSLSLIWLLTGDIDEIDWLNRGYTLICQWDGQESSLLKHYQLGKRQIRLSDLFEEFINYTISYQWNGSYGESHSSQAALIKIPHLIQVSSRNSDVSLQIEQGICSRAIELEQETLTQMLKLLLPQLEHGNCIINAEKHATALKLKKNALHYYDVNFSLIIPRIFGLEELDKLAQTILNAHQTEYASFQFRCFTTNPLQSISLTEINQCYEHSYLLMKTAEQKDLNLLELQLQYLLKQCTQFSLQRTVSLLSFLYLWGKDPEVIKPTRAFFFKSLSLMTTTDPYPLFIKTLKNFLNGTRELSLLFELVNKSFTIFKEAPDNAKIQLFTCIKNALLTYLETYPTELLELVKSNTETLCEHFSEFSLENILYWSFCLFALSKELLTIYCESLQMLNLETRGNLLSKLISHPSYRQACSIANFPTQMIQGQGRNTLFFQYFSAENLSVSSNLSSKPYHPQTPSPK